jgi:hypothetical protein
MESKVKNGLKLEKTFWITKNASKCFVHKTNRAPDEIRI